MEELFDKLFNRFRELQDAVDARCSEYLVGEARDSTIDALNDYIDKRIELALIEHTRR